MMHNTGHERRRDHRVAFATEITAILSEHYDSNERKHVVLINLSLSGMQFTVKSSDRNPFKRGDRLYLSQINHRDKAYADLNIEIEILWILNPPTLRYIGIGCRFLSVSSESQIQLSKIMSEATE